MAKDPAVLFYTSDFLSGTYTMTDEQVGKYIRLLCLQHQKGRLSEKDMQSICKAYDVEIWSKFENENGEFFNVKMEQESKRRKKYTESRRNNAKKEDMQSICSTYEKHMHKHMETETETITDTKTINKNSIAEKISDELPEQYIQSSIEQLKIQKDTSINRDQVIAMWAIFKAQNLSSGKYYNNEHEVYRHFSNWIKNQKFEKNGKSTTKTISSVSNQRMEQSIEYLNRYAKKDSTRD
jgi:hypothetical protein